MSVVLVVDDSADVRLLIRVGLVESGFDVIEAASGDEAQRLWGHADAVLMDLTLPDVDGLDLLAARVGTGPPVVVVSVDAGAGRGARALALGAAARVRKPFEVDHLVAVIQAAIDSGHGSASSLG